MKLRATALVLCLGLVACDDAAPAAWLAEAREAHRAADEHPGDEAHSALRAFVERPVPAGVNEIDARIVRQDMCFRLARIDQQAERHEEARRWAERGLGLGIERDLFTANLYVARGEARQAMGDAVGAAADYHEALLINDALLERALRGEDTR